MLAGIISTGPTGPDNTPFYNAMAVFLNKFKYLSANAIDFWGQIANEIREQRNLVNLTSSWMSDPGYPLLTFTTLSNGRLQVRQERFLVDQSTPVASTGRYWWLPFTIRYKIGDLTYPDKYTLVRTLAFKFPTTKLEYSFFLKKTRIDTLSPFPKGKIGQTFNSLLITFCSNLPTPSLK